MSDKMMVRMTATRPGPDGVVLPVDTDQCVAVNVGEMLVANNWANQIHSHIDEAPAPEDPAPAPDPVKDEPKQHEEEAAPKPERVKAHTKRAPKTKAAS